jgi:hypothetical protein
MNGLAKPNTKVVSTRRNVSETVVEPNVDGHIRKLIGKRQQDRFDEIDTGGPRRHGPDCTDRSLATVIQFRTPIQP